MEKFPIAFHLNVQKAGSHAPMKPRYNSPKIIHMKAMHFLQIRIFSIIFFPTKRPKERPTTETSKLCVKRVCTKSILESGITCVLS
jgi:hypothetical protein